jgi:hypothetical protein
MEGNMTRRPVARAPLFLAAICLAGAAPAWAEKVKDPLKVVSEKSFKDTQKVIIAGFTLGFMIERKDRSRAGGGLMGGFGGNSSAKSILAGVSDAEFQEISDAAYQDFVRQMGEAGFEVVDRSALAAYPPYAKLKSHPAGTEISFAIEKDDKAKARFFPASATAPWRMISGDIAVGMSTSMAVGQGGVAVSQYANETGIPVVNIVYVVDFADADEYGGAFAFSSAVKVNSSIALLPLYSKLTLVAPKYKTASIELKEPVAIGGDFAEKADTTGGGAKAVETVSNVIGFLGGVGTNVSRKYTFTVKPGAYPPMAAQAIGAANARIVARLSGLK